MAMTGFDPQLVKDSIGSVKTAYDNLITAIGTNMQSDFIGGMTEVWACTDAQDFFRDAFKPSVDGLISSANKIFDSVITAMNGAALRWASDTKSLSSYSSVSFTTTAKTMDISGIKENINGIRGIDKDLAETVAGKLTTIADSAKTALISAQSAVQNCGFVGGEQASSLISSLGTIKTNIDNAVQSITTSSKTAVTNTITKYSDTAGKIKEAFAGQDRA